MQSREGELLFSRFTKQVQEIFDNLPKPLDWIPFYTNDLNSPVQSDQEQYRTRNYVSISSDLNTTLITLYHLGDKSNIPFCRGISKITSA